MTHFLQLLPVNPLIDFGELLPNYDMQRGRGGVSQAVGYLRWLLVRASLVAQCIRLHLTMKEMQKIQVRYLGLKDPTPVFLPGRSHGPINLVGYNPWDLKESSTTDHAHTQAS